MNKMKAILVALLFIFFSVPAWACETDFARDYMADPNGVADATPNWNQAMADEVPCLTILGQFRFYSPPDPITHGPAIVGESTTVSQLIRAYDDGTFIKISGLSGGRISNLAILADTGTTGGLGLHVEVGPQGAAAAWDIEGINVQGHGSPFGTFDWPMHIWGDGGALLGWRDGYIQNVTLYGFESGALFCRSCSSVKIIGITTYGTNAKVWLDNHSRVTITGADIQGPLQINAQIVALSLLGSWP